MKIFSLRDSLLVAAVLTAVATGYAVSAVAAPPQRKLFNMTEQLDKLDQQDFQEAISKANHCTIMRDFVCTAEQLRKASKLAKGSRDLQALETATRNMRLEESRIAQEAADREERERQLRRAQVEEEFREEERRAEERMRMAQQESSSSVDYGQAFAEGVNSQMEFFSDLNKIHNQTMRDINRTTRENQMRAEAQRLANERAEADRRDRENERIRQQSQARLQLAQQQADQRALEQANERRVQQQLAAKQQEQEQARLQQEQERKKEQARLQQEQDRQQEQARKKADDAAAKRAEGQKKKQEEETYLQGVKAGIKLVATKCPGGEGKYYATGTLPRIKPEAVACIDVYFRAYCSGSVDYVSGMAHNFVGMAGCFGDTYAIEPTPPCKVDQVRIEVEKVVPCKF